MAAPYDDDATLPASEPASPASAPVSTPVSQPSGRFGTASGAAAVERYDMGPLLGRGGMGEVRLARDTRIDREVAVKLMRSELRDSLNIARFFREARVQGALEHPSVVPVHDLGIDPAGNPYFVMKKLAGRTLADVLAKPDDAWPRNLVLSRFADVCLAMAFAHQRGVVHRDLKPANIMVGDFGEAYVLDWGLARVGDERAIRDVVPLSGEVPRGQDGDSAHTAAGDLLGTPGYMPPEQAKGEVVTASADVFSLGCVLFEILAGQPALPKGMTAIPLTLAADDHRPSERAPTADIPPELDDLCALATAAEPTARPTARALADKIRAYLDGDRDLGQRKELATLHAARAIAAFEDATGRAIGAGVSDMTATTRRAPMTREQLALLASVPRGKKRTGHPLRAAHAEMAAALAATPPAGSPAALAAVEARAVAMREAGRALVLDASNVDAQHVLSRLLLEPPRELPPDVVETVEKERRKQMQTVLRASVIPYLALTVGFCLIFLFPVRHTGPIVVGAVGSALGGGLLWRMSRRPIPTSSPSYVAFASFNLVLLFVGCMILGPLLLVPVFTIGSLTAILAQPVPFNRVALTLLHALPIILAIVLEQLAILPPTFRIEHGGLLLTPWVMDLTPVALLVIFSAGMLVQFINSSIVVTIQRRAQEAAQNRLHAQAWQLRQLDPSAPAPREPASPRA